MRHVTIWASLAFPVLLPAALAPGEEPSGASAPETATPPARFFDRPVDFWRSAPAGEANSDPVRPRGSAIPSDWGQVVRMPDGRLAYHELPRPLVEVLEDPSPEHLQAYFEWREARTRKIFLAAERMREYREKLEASEERGRSPGGDPESEAPPPGSPLPEAAREVPVPELSRPATLVDRPIRILYFHRTGCAPCAAQDLLLAPWLRTHPEAVLETIEFGSRPELWKRYRVRGTPTIALEREGAPPGPTLEGLSGPEALESALGRLRPAPSPEPSAERRKAP